MDRYKIIINNEVLAIVKSKGLAFIVAEKFKEIYKTDNVEIKKTRKIID